MSSRSLHATYAEKFEKQADEIERLNAEVRDLKEIEAAAVGAFYLNGYHDDGGCMCSNCLLKLILDRHSTVIKQDRETVKRMSAAEDRQVQSDG